MRPQSTGRCGLEVCGRPRRRPTCGRLSGPKLKDSYQSEMQFERFMSVGGVGEPLTYFKVLLTTIPFFSQFVPRTPSWQSHA